MKLKDKVAIVTGSSRGIGKAIAIDFAKEVAAVVIAARTEAEQGGLPGTKYSTAKEIQDSGGTALAIKRNVAEEESVAELFTWANAKRNNSLVAQVRDLLIFRSIGKRKSLMPKEAQDMGVSLQNAFTVG